MGALVKPRALQAGDEVAVITPSGGIAHRFPHVADAGLDALRTRLRLTPREYPTTRAPVEASPRDRARDLMVAVADPAIAAIVVTGSGDDALRLLPYLDLAAIASSPKVVMGFGDATVLLLAWHAAGVVAFHGPTAMVGLAQAPSMPATFVEQLQAVLFEGDAHAYQRFPWWTQSYPDWGGDPANATDVGTKYTRDALRVVQGSGMVTAPALGGCVAALTASLGTTVFPEPAAWDGAFLLLETPAGPPRPGDVQRLLWNLAAQGALARVAGIVLGRPQGYRPDQRVALEQAIVEAVRDLGRDDFPIISGLGLGRTAPQIVLPLGVPITIDLDQGTLALAEPAVVR